MLLRYFLFSRFPLHMYFFTHVRFCFDFRSVVFLYLRLRFVFVFFAVLLKGCRFFYVFFIREGYMVYEVRPRLLLNLLLFNSQKRASVEHLPQHSTARSVMHKAAKHVRADQSATTQASRQSWREPAMSSSIYLQLCSQNQRRNRSLPDQKLRDHKQLLVAGDWTRDGLYYFPIST